ncbi:MAG: hypothetical protein FWE22_02615 [Firmicutes bacterium]|nr:hypothetical protein [Bacillota bacterium]
MIEQFLNDRNKTKQLLSHLMQDDIRQKETNIKDKLIFEKFCDDLKKAKKHIKDDAEFLFKNDPSVSDIIVMNSYTSVFAVACYRIAHIYPCEIVSRQIAEYAKSLTGVDIHPNARIGVPFALDHGVGTVIGETSVIGSNSMLYHGVTLGARHLKEREQVGEDRHPKLGNNVIVYSNTTILGNLFIPDNSIIGANKFIKNQKDLDEICLKQGTR